MSDLTQQGIAALKRGDKTQARQLFQAALRQNPDNIRAWLWLSGAVEADQERIFCLQQVLRRDPNNQRAAKGLAKLTTQERAVPQFQARPAAETPSAVPQSPSEPAPAKPVTAPLPSLGPPTIEPPIPARERPAAVLQEGLAEPQTQEREAVGFSVQPSLLPVGVVIIGLFIIVAVGISIGLGMNTGEIWQQILKLVLFIALFLLALAVTLRMFRALWTRLFTRYLLTRDTLIVQQGRGGSGRRVIPLDRIQDVSYGLGILKRLVGVGTVMVEIEEEPEPVRLIDLHHCRMYGKMIMEAVPESAQVSQQGFGEI